MKLFQKLIAAVLTAGLSLLLLAGCSSTALDEKELAAALNDLHFLRSQGIETITAGDSTLAKKALAQAKTYVEQTPDAGLNADAVFKRVYYNSAFEYYSPKPYGRLLDLAGICTAVVPKDCPDAYYFSYVRLNDFQSQEFHKNRAAHIAEILADRSWATNMNSIPEEELAAYAPTATPSIATETNSGHQYLVVIFVQAAK